MTFISIDHIQKIQESILDGMRYYDSNKTWENTGGNWEQMNHPRVKFNTCNFYLGWAMLKLRNQVFFGVPFAAILRGVFISCHEYSQLTTSLVGSIRLSLLTSPGLFTTRP